MTSHVCQGWVRSEAATEPGAAAALPPAAGLLFPPELMPSVTRKTRLWARLDLNGQLKTTKLLCWVNFSSFPTEIFNFHLPC